MGNFIIDQKIEKLEKVKANLLTLKKAQRGEELKQVNQMIGRLKRWNNELAQQSLSKKYNEMGAYEKKHYEPIYKLEQSILNAAHRTKGLVEAIDMKESEYKKLALGDFTYSNNDKKCNNCDCNEENNPKQCNNNTKKKQEFKPKDYYD